MAQGQPAPSDNFVVISQVAQNPLKSFVLTLFVLKKLPCVFFKKAEKYGQNHVRIHPSVSTQYRISILESKTQCMCVVYVIGGGGGLSRTCLKPCFTACGKTEGYLFHQKCLHGKFQWVLSNSENRYKFVTWGKLLRAPSIIEFSFAKSKTGSRLVDRGMS